MGFPLNLRVTAMALRLEDRDLVLAYQAGDDDAFAELVREYRPQLLGHARRKLGCPEAAEDAVQEALVRALRAMPRFNGNYLVGPWLHRILSNVCSDEGNRQRREGEKTERYASDSRALNPPPTLEDQLGLDIDDSELADAVDNLSEQYREALMLRFVEELSYEEVAAAAGVSEQNARARVSRARNAVRAALKLAAAAPVALVGLLRRGERAAAAVSGQTAPGGGRAALQSAMPALAEAAPMASRATAAAANTATVAAGAAVTGVPGVAKAAVGLGLATAVVAPTVDSPVHRAAERVLPASVMEVLTPLAVEVPAPDAPVVVPAAAAPVTSAAVQADPAGAEAAVPAAAETEAPSAPAPVAEQAPQAAQAAVPAAAPAAAAADGGGVEAAVEKVADASKAVETSVATEVVIQPVTTVSDTSSVQGAQLTFTPAGADRYDVSGSLSLTVTTVTTVASDGEESTETVTTNESVAVVSPSSASLEAADPEAAERRFSALLVFAPDDSGASAEMRLAARGTPNDDGSLAMTGYFSAAGTDSLPLAERGNLSGTLTLDADGAPATLTVTLTQ